MLVDPRPYTYEYRKPRYSNPTLYPLFHSANPETFMTVSSKRMVVRAMTSLARGTLLVLTRSAQERSKGSWQEISQMWREGPKMTCRWSIGTRRRQAWATSYHRLARQQIASECPRISEAWRTTWAVLTSLPNADWASSASRSTSASRNPTTSSAATLRSKTTTSSAITLS